MRIRYRIDGVLVERDSPPRRLLGALLSRIKILANVDIAERRRPQDGRIKVTLGDKQLDLSLHGRYSKEPDYLSRGMGFGAALSFDQRNTIFSRAAIPGPPRCRSWSRPAVSGVCDQT